MANTRPLTTVEAKAMATRARVDAQRRSGRKGDASTVEGKRGNSFGSFGDFRRRSTRIRLSDGSFARR